MPNAEAALNFYKANLGLKEYPDGSNNNWITQLWGFQFPWCAATFTLSQRTAWDLGSGKELPQGYGIDVPNVLYVPSWREAFIAAGRYDLEPQVGDAVIFTWGFGFPTGDHIGILEEIVGDGTFITLEGNTGRNELARVRRSLAVIDGFGHPFYTEVKPAPKEKDLPMNFIYKFKNQDYVYLGVEGYYGFLPFGDLLDALKGSKQLHDYGDQTKEFHDGVTALANSLGYKGIK